MSINSLTETDELAKKQQEAVYIELAASAAGSGDFHRAQQILRIAENLYSTPLGKKILIAAQKARKKAQKQAAKSSGSSDSDGSEASEEDEDDEEDDDEDDDDEEKSEGEDDSESEDILPVNLKSFGEACTLLEEAEKYFAKHEMELLNQSLRSEVQVKREIRLPFADKRSWKWSNEKLNK